ncbi:MAG: hypothetical protein VE98_C0001G0031 [candidate division Kazan bacterium GW2011_GWA1_50_15]|uniref:Septum formation initiator n=2 Tax=Bacteria division Kazan-3B-28 TaxID=1798534 RepID=A0A0G1X7J9_UNCK3|nr:MAG: hypothetical protein VE98_C0001G0031 [candidate division Kazan bacterium GW2011_GWA1_50_15]KKW25686.1 MAG: hypothetical protein VE99_C0001G0325 [candidate division Kazan bacterium GW2011_GWC1_52_13]KKW26991.1 MAG: hypothetical protein VF00_C0002G0318 [candidate division Kazan bacterium GW2011_GWB1_52_7]HAV66021.1 hypothetical protein [Patescibacteria group bacterium]HCR42590.1 hypothetical protein [Patescibacteria group bacterium]
MSGKLPKIQLLQGRELRVRMIMTIGVVIAVYMIVSTIQALWQNYQINKELIRLRDENAELKLQNNYLQNLIAYRQTESFKDKEARAKLNYQKPGEIVLIIPDDDTARFQEGNIKEQPDTNGSLVPNNPQKWWRYFFG